MLEEKTKKNLSGKRIYKDSVFRMLFKEKDALLSLYNAIFDTKYDDPMQIEITTLENAIYMGIKNDVSCILDFHLALMEHQSTVNPNMPLRSLMYVADLYEKQTAELDIYSGRQIMLPNPQFVVFYNGLDKQPEKKIMFLSDAYYHKDKEVSLELKVLQLNINPGYNEDIVSKCPALFEYIQFVDCVRKHQRVLPVPEAVDEAVKECIHKGILEGFLRKNRAEVMKMSIYEYDEEKHLRILQRESWEDGWEEGCEAGISAGVKQGTEQTYYRMFRNHKTPQEISKFTGESLGYLYQVQEKYLKLVREEGKYDMH